VKSRPRSGESGDRLLAPVRVELVKTTAFRQLTVILTALGHLADQPPVAVGVGGARRDAFRDGT